MAVRNLVCSEDTGKSGKNRVLCRLAAQRRAGLVNQTLQPLLLTITIIKNLAVPHNLAIHNIIAIAAPCVKHGGVGSHGVVKDT